MKKNNSPEPKRNSDPTSQNPKIMKKVNTLNVDMTNNMTGTSSHQLMFN